MNGAAQMASTYIYLIGLIMSLRMNLILLGGLGGTQTRARGDIYPQYKVQYIHTYFPRLYILQN